MKSLSALTSVKAKLPASDIPYLALMTLKACRICLKREFIDSFINAYKLDDFRLKFLIQKIEFGRLIWLKLLLFLT